MSLNEIVVNRPRQDVKLGVVQSEPLVVRAEINATAPEIVEVHPEIMLVVHLRLHKILNLLDRD